jgi:hypothetical protein
MVRFHPLCLPSTKVFILFYVYLAVDLLTSISKLLRDPSSLSDTELHHRLVISFKHLLSKEYESTDGKRFLHFETGERDIWSVEVISIFFFYLLVVFILYVGRD